MGRPRKPTSVLRFTGAFKHNPHRESQRANEPGQRARLTESAPADLPKGLEDIWEKLVAIAPLDVLSDCDEFAVIATCILIARLYNQSITTGEIAQLRIYLGELGMTPASRSRVMPLAFGAPPVANGAPKKTGNKFADL